MWAYGTFAHLTWGLFMSGAETPEPHPQLSTKVCLCVPCFTNPECCVSVLSDDLVLVVR